MREQPLGLRSNLAVLRRRWRLLLGAAAAGLVAGAVYGAVTPARLSSSTLVLLPVPVGGQQGASNSQIDTQVLILTSHSVLDQAGQRMSPRMTAEQVRDDVEVLPLTDQLLEIKGFSAGARTARSLSQTVADTYITATRDTARLVTAATLADLHKRQDTLTKQGETLRAEIEAAQVRQRSAVSGDSQAGARESQLIGRLRADEAATVLQLDKVKDDIFNHSSTGSAAQAGISVIQQATPAVGTGLVTRLVRDGALGALLLAAAGAVLLVARARRDPRVRPRDDIADGLGGVVLADVRSAPQRSVAEWGRLFAGYDPGPVEAWALRRLLHALAGADGDHPGSVTVIVASGDERALALGPQLAAFAASTGLVTRFVPAGDRGHADALWAACAADRDATPRPGLHLTAPPATEEEPGAVEEAPEKAPEKADAKTDAKAPEKADAKAPEKADAKADGSEEAVVADLTVVVTVVDLERPGLRDVPGTAATVLAVAPGVATRVQLARLALAVDDAGRALDGVVVVDPDAWDATTGRRSLQERSRGPALPVRLTGAASAVTPIGRGRAS